MCNIKDPILLLFKEFVALKIVKIRDQFYIPWIDVWNEIIRMTAIHDSFSEILYCISRQEHKFSCCLCIWYSEDYFGEQCSSFQVCSKIWIQNDTDSKLKTFFHWKNRHPRIISPGKGFQSWLNNRSMWDWVISSRWLVQ